MKRKATFIVSILLLIGALFSSAYFYRGYSMAMDSHDKAQVEFQAAEEFMKEKEEERNQLQSALDQSGTKVESLTKEKEEAQQLLDQAKKDHKAERGW